MDVDVARREHALGGGESLRDRAPVARHGVKAIAFAYTHEDETVADLVAAIGTDPAIARANYELYFHAWKAFDPKLRLSATALMKVEEAMIEASVLDRKSAPDAKAFFDPSYLTEALR